MSVESATYVNQLDPAHPTGSEVKSEGDDHIRKIKYTITNSMPNVGGIITASHTELSYVTGVTSAIQTQLDLKATIASPTFTGSPRAPTQAANDSSTLIATTAQVAGAIAASAATAGLSSTTAGPNKVPLADAGSNIDPAWSPCYRDPMYWALRPH